MEFKVFVDGVERVICGVTSQTTVRDIVLCLAQATQQFGKFVLIEKLRQNERLLAPNELPLQILNKWADLSNEVCFIMRRSDVHQQIQQQQQFISEPLYSTVQRPVFNNVLNPINQMNQLNQINQLNQMNQLNNQLNNRMNNPLNNQLNSMQQQIYYQQPNNVIFKQNVINKPNLISQQQEFNQQIYTTSTKYQNQQLNHNLNMNQQLNLSPQLNQQFHPQQLLHVQQPNIQNKQLLPMHQHSPLNQMNQINQMNQLNNQVYGQVRPFEVRQINNQMNLVPQQYSPNVIKLTNNMPINNQMIGNQMNINQLNQQLLNQQQYFCRQNLTNDLNNDPMNVTIKNSRPKCPPPYNEAIAKSSLLQNNSPVNTSHSPSLNQQQQSDYYSSTQNQSNRLKLNSVVSNPNLQQITLTDRSNSSPSPNNQQIIRSSTSQPNMKTETYYHVNVAQLKSKFDNNALDPKSNAITNLNVKTLDKTSDKKSIESSFLIEKENRTVMKQLNQQINSKTSNGKDAIIKDQKSIYETYIKHPNLSIEDCDELNRSDYQINNYQTDQLEALQKETERIEKEKNQIANNINETDLKIAKCRQKIQILMDEIKDVSIEKENEKIRIEEEINLKQINEIKQKIDQSIKEYESSSEKLNKLQSELDKLESTLNERKKMIDKLTADIKEANIVGLTLIPLEDSNGNILNGENENRAPSNENLKCELNGNKNRFNVRLGSTRKCLKITNDGDLPVQHGVWV